MTYEVSIRYCIMRAVSNLQGVTNGSTRDVTASRCSPWLGG